MEQVRKMVRAGVGFATAVKESLAQLPEPLTIDGLAAKYSTPERPVHPTAISAAINGTVRASEAVIDALVGELGGTPDEWRWALWQAARPPYPGRGPAQSGEPGESEGPGSEHWSAEPMQDRDDAEAAGVL